MCRIFVVNHYSFHNYDIKLHELSDKYNRRFFNDIIWYEETIVHEWYSES